MIQYIVSYTQPHRHFIAFEATFEHDGSDRLVLQLPSWRPGRYELGFFAKNVRGWKAFSDSGELLGFRKLTRDSWEIDAGGLRNVKISYEYFAAELNAGSSYLDEEQLYLNPVNCFLYNTGKTNEAYTVRFRLPEAYEIASGLRQSERHVLEAGDFDELADCPIIASASLRHVEYDVDGVRFRIWIQGEHRLDQDKLIEQFGQFTREQVSLFGSFPSDEYHFLFQFTPYFVRHGVEHRNSTVIAMGPVADFLHQAWYDEFLGISSHELFHTWNVKLIRPADMLPYDFTRENYSRTGYVTEGVTTYYGDVILFRCGIFSEARMLDILSQTVQRHFDNPGRFSMSVADSSWDTWLDGYTQGIPGRKVSIYNEGCLIAWICDVKIRLASSGKYSLDDVMRALYERFGKRNTGYTTDQYRELLEEFSGTSFVGFQREVIEGCADYTPYLEETISALGLKWSRVPSGKWSEAYLGFSVEEGGGRVSISQVAEGSPADRAGLWKDDEIVSVNGVAPYKNVQHLLRMNSGKDICLVILRKYRHFEIHLREDGHIWQLKHVISRNAEATPEQIRAWERWSASANR